MFGVGGVRRTRNSRSAMRSRNESMHSAGVRCLPVIPQAVHIEKGMASLAASSSFMSSEISKSHGNARSASYRYTPRPRSRTRNSAGARAVLRATALSLAGVVPGGRGAASSL